MKDTNRQNARNRQKKRRERDAPGPSSDRPMESYTPAQQRMVRNGLRILAKVAIRAHLRRSAGRLDSEEDRDGQRDDTGDDYEGRRGV